MLFCPVLPGEARAAGKVTTHQDANGWKLLVKGNDYFIKGVVWGYTPIGENYAYDLWSYPEEHIKKVVDYEAKLLQEAGVNTVRTFMDTPPKWVQYLYEEYGIMSIVNPMTGRYGYTVNGVWHPVVDYSDEATRTAIKRDILAVVEQFKNTPGVLMLALGNEDNYGLEWKSPEIQNLPEGEQQTEKAKFLYSLYNEIIAEAKKIDASHPYAIVNGEVQYIDLIAALCPELDILGLNVYRGRSFTDLWSTVQQKLNLPIVFMELGSDAYNAMRGREDQYPQADIITAQWKEIYQKTYGKGAEGNALGGFVLEWRDGWWKYEQTENLDIHDRNASWSNGGYPFDFVYQGKNNMNEEWFGIMQNGPLNEDAIAAASPRLAYYALKEVWQADPYRMGIAETDRLVDGVNLQELAAQYDIRLLPEKRPLTELFYLESGNIELEYVDNSDAINESSDSSIGAAVNLDFVFHPTYWLSGDFTLNYIANSAEKSLEEYYGKERSDNSVKVYDFNATMDLEYYNLNAFRHVPRYHWQYDGDFFGLLWEATDMEGMDIWEARAPYGVEFVGKKALDGLKIVAGPEVYWGANPKWIAKYTFSRGDFTYTVMHSEDYDRSDDATGQSTPTERETRATTVSLKTTIIPGATIQLGAIVSNPEKEGETYDYLDGGRVLQDEIEFADTLGFKAKILMDGFDFGHAYLAGSYAGRVADGGEPLKEFDTMLPYSQYGNKVEIEGGIGIFRGDYTIYPRLLYRKNIEDANPLIEPYISGTTLFPGIVPRNREDDPFAVLDNREALSGEIFFTYDPTPETDFYHWDNKHQEDAPVAFNIGFNYTEFRDITDAFRFYEKEFDAEYAFPEGLPKEDVWKILSRVVFNPTKYIRLANRFELAFQQAEWSPEGPARQYFSWEFDYSLAQKHTVSGYVKREAWGPYDYYRQFNVTYPWQFKLDYSYRLDSLIRKWVPGKIGKKATIGIYGIYRTLDEDSPKNEYLDGENERLYQITTYLTYGF
jgi:hypothetical protein